LYDENYELMRNYFLRRLPGGEVNDAMADLFLVAWRRIDGAPPGRDGRLWLYGVARNVVHNTQRSVRRRTRLTGRLGGTRPPSMPGPETLVVQNVADAGFHDALAALRPDDQEILRLSIWEELTNAEIADVLGIDPHAVTMRLSRARNRLAAQLGIPRTTTRGKRTVPNASTEEVSS
jgi:RNA polymerase sigma-70 factor (ECF subfamily)